MRPWAKAVALFILSVLLIVAAVRLQPPWWAASVGIGLLIFVCYAAWDTRVLTFGVGSFVLGLSALLLIGALLVSWHHGVPLMELSGDRSIYRKVRRLPDHALALFTFSIATFIAAWLRRLRHPKTRKRRSNDT